jgi:hypothetical protein
MAWGDAKDPVLSAPPVTKQKRGLHQPHRKLKKPRSTAIPEIAEAQGHLDALTAGEDEDDLFAVSPSSG